MPKTAKIKFLKSIYEIGPRKVTMVGGRAAVYLGKPLNFLVGKYVLLTVKVLEEPGEEAASNA